VSRIVTLVLIDRSGRLLGALPPYEVPMPWWQEVSDVVPGARRLYGVDVSVLRLLATERPEPHGGAVTYLGQVAERPSAPLVPVEVDLSPHPLRAPWAEPSGPARTLAWAEGELQRLGRPVGNAAQQRTWNLSAIWRLDGVRGPVWLKQVPAFFQHEAAVLRWLGERAPGYAPVLLADDGAGRMLLDHVPGEDLYDGAVDLREAIAADHHAVQLRTVEEVEQLVALGVPDRRAEPLARWIRGALAPYQTDAVGGLLAGLHARLEAVRECGLPDTLVHGDLHPGNVRGDGDRRVLIDWGDAVVGHPAFDILRLADGVDASKGEWLRRRWSERWRASVPGCDPDRAVALLRAVAALYFAAVYATFVANIEPSERPFHAADVPAYVARAAAELEQVRVAP
jgi:aminoglycoside phosphotransferase (APT) family kinase protein